MTDKPSKIAIIIPASNEEFVIEKTLLALLEYVEGNHIYLVDDNSKDLTRRLALSHLPKQNILTLTINHGKAACLNEGIKKFELTKRYEHIMPVDADTIPSSQFLANVMQVFEDDKQQKIAAVVGKVMGKNSSWITAYRLWEYEMSQVIYKSSQNIIGTIAVCPGCATVYRAAVFTKTSFSKDTVTEDMDLTFEIHRKKLGLIKYCPSATVVTQDPGTVKDFAKQVEKWYKGFWQCVVKHNVPWGGQKFDLEVAILATEGVFNGLLVLALIVLSPIILKYNYMLLFYPLIFDFWLFFMPSLIYAVLKYKDYMLMLYIPQFYFMRLLTGLIFIKSFFMVLLGITPSGHWSRTRRWQISADERKLWLSPSLD